MATLPNQEGIETHYPDWETGGQHSERTGVLSEVVSGVSFPPNPKFNTLNHRFGIEMIEGYLKMIYCRRLRFLSQL